MTSNKSPYSFGPNFKSKNQKHPQTSDCVFSETIGTHFNLEKKKFFTAVKTDFDQISNFRISNNRDKPFRVATKNTPNGTCQSIFFTGTTTEIKTKR